MRPLLLLLVVLASAHSAFAGSSKSQGKGAPKPPPAPEAPPAPAPPPAWAEDLLAAVDPAADACTDFYQYACGTWLANTPLPADKPAYGRSFSTIRDRNLDTVKAIVESAALNPKGKDDDWRKLGETYGSCMEDKAIDAEDTVMLQPLFKEIDGVKSVKTFMRTAGHLSTMGVSGIVDAGIEGDFKDPNRNILYLAEGGLALPDKDYYFPTDDAGKKTLADYQAHVAKMLEFSGVQAKDAPGQAAEVVAFETKLAEAWVNKAELRDPAKSYNKIDRAGLIKLTPKLHWGEWLNAMGGTEVMDISIDAPGTFKKFEKILDDADVSTLRAYLRFHTIHAFAPNLAKRIFLEDFSMFQANLLGRKEPEPRWKRCIAHTNTAVGEVAGRYYVEKAFPGDSKEVAKGMLGDIQAAFVAGLPSLAWMDDTTRERAKEKSAKIGKKIGYPDKWRDYSKLQVTPYSHVTNVLAAAVFEHERNLVKVGQPVDRNEWYMTPQTVNAYYNPLTNEFAYPAGILQAPFFSRDFPAARNYGAIGAVMGHELSHGFDDQGRKFDGDGKMTEWWSPEVSTRYEAQTKCVKEQFDGFAIADGTHVKGDLTLGENIGDLGGVRASYRAFQATAGYKEPTGIATLNQDQLFFVAYAQNWCTVSSPQYDKMIVASNPHSPNRFRVLGPLQNLPEFHAAFGCAVGSGMRPAKQCEVW
ncbi:peptidase M13 [Deltaproteobacteria bacterium]|nr:peptidase M13 [Deltaproteobacteria bacterium]